MDVHICMEAIGITTTIATVTAIATATTIATVTTIVVNAIATATANPR